MFYIDLVRLTAQTVSRNQHSTNSGTTPRRTERVASNGRRTLCRQSQEIQFCSEFIRWHRQSFSKPIDCSIKITRCVIIYPHARELFAFTIGELRGVNQIEFTFVRRGPRQHEKLVAKISSMTIMRLPRWKGVIARNTKLKSALGFGCVGGLLALINISRTVPEINLLINTDSKVRDAQIE